MMAKDWKHNEEFWNYVRREAQIFRHKKIKEVFAKENPTDFELLIIKQWANDFGSKI